MLNIFGHDYLEIIFLEQMVHAGKSRIWLLDDSENKGLTCQDRSGCFYPVAN